MKTYTLENKQLKIEIASLGGTILSFIDKSDNTDIVLGFKTVEEYPNNGYFFGAMIGRHTNRIANGKYQLNGVEYQMEINNGPNNLHSGTDTFAFKEFEEEYYENNKLVLTYHSKDMESGFPGNLTFICIYELKDNKLSINFSGTSDKDTIFNVTNHSYFNLGEETILNHELYVPTNKLCLDDENGMASDEIIDVTNTSFDFTEYKKIKDNFDLKHHNLVAGGIDHNYVYENFDKKLVAKLRNAKRELTIYSDLPDLQVYTACGFDLVDGKKRYPQYGGVALEPQFAPNAINYDKFIKPILKKNETKAYSIEYVLERR